MANWPPALKDFVAKVLAEGPKTKGVDMESVRKELKETIKKAHDSKNLWEVEWSKVTLKSLKPNGSSTPNGGGKRKKNPLLFTASPVANAEEDSKRLKRLKRFEANTMQARIAGDLPMVANNVRNMSLESARSPPSAPFVDLEDYIQNIPDWDEHTLVGTSQKLEKPYLRLTSDPKVEDVRPLAVLKKSLELLTYKWKNNTADYNYICSQFKSLRQDLTVQRIKNDFTVQVYEIHARVALEKGDLGEFNQCSSQLINLYKMGIRGKAIEFLAYRILYLLYSRDLIEINTLLAEVSPSDKKAACVQHAMQVRFAMATNNYVQLFKLYFTAPNMGGYLMDKFVGRERVRALATMSRAYKFLPVDMLILQLGFDSDEECRKFLELHRIEHYTDVSRLTWNAAASRAVLQEEIKKAQKVDLKGQI